MDGAAELRGPLELARDAVHGPRQADYGHPRVNHGCTASLWTTWLRRRGLLADGAELTPRDVCWLNILQKASRDANAPTLDNLVDAAGYAENAHLAGEPAP